MTDTLREAIKRLAARDYAHPAQVAARALVDDLREVLATHPAPAPRPGRCTCGLPGCSDEPDTADDEQPVSDDPERITPCRRSPVRGRWECITWPDEPTAYPCAHDHSHCDYIGCVEHVDGMHVDKTGDAIVHVGCGYPSSVPAGSACECPPCPGRGNDGHGMTHCAECCFGTGVVADIGCPIHGEAAVQTGSDTANEPMCESCGHSSGLHSEDVPGCIECQCPKFASVPAPAQAPKDWRDSPRSGGMVGTMTDPYRGSDTADEPVVGCGARIPSPDPRISFVCSLPVLHDGPHSNEMPGTTPVPSPAPADEREALSEDVFIDTGRRALESRGESIRRSSLGRVWDAIQPLLAAHDAALCARVAGEIAEKIEAMTGSWIAGANWITAEDAASIARAAAEGGGE